jgi:hypothetical protein
MLPTLGGVDQARRVAAPPPGGEGCNKKPDIEGDDEKAINSITYVQSC